MVLSAEEDGNWELGSGEEADALAKRSPLLGQWLDTEERGDPGVFALFVVFGISSWLTVNSTWAELPELVRRVPEGWAIATYMSFALQLANVGPVCYSYVRVRGLVTMCNIIYGLLLLGTVASLLLAVLWEHTTRLGGDRHSVALLLLCFVSGVVDCTTTLVYWPFAALFPKPYTVAMAVGESLSGTTTGVLSLIQDPGGEMRFSVAAFFVLVAALMVASLLAFSYLNRPEVGRRAGRRAAQPAAAIVPAAGTPSLGRDSVGGGAEGAQVQLPWRDVVSSVGAPLLVLSGVSLTANGVFVSITTFIFLPYPHGSELLLWSSALATFTDPLVALAGTWFKTRRIGLLTALWAPASMFLVALAAASPSPPLREVRAGLRTALAPSPADSPPHPTPLQQSLPMGIFLVLLYVAARGVLTYTKVMALVMVRSSAPPPHLLGGDGEKGDADIVERWPDAAAEAAGTVIQGSAFVGSLTMFVLVVWGGMFSQS